MLTPPHLYIKNLQIKLVHFYLLTFTTGVVTLKTIGS